MAASAIATLPFIKTGRTTPSSRRVVSDGGATVATSDRPRPREHREHGIWTDPCAQSAAGACRGVSQPNRVIAELIHDRNVEHQHILGADGNAEAAALASVNGDVQ